MRGGNIKRMVGVFVVGNIVYYTIDNKLLGYQTIKELSDTTQTTIVI